MAKEYKNINVYEAAQQRIEYIFNEFDNILVAFSGGKDSGVVLNLIYDYAKEHRMLDKMAYYHLDYEAQYQMTTDYVEETFKTICDVRRYWCCLPIAANCGCSMESDHWIPWEKSKRDIWCREMPKYEYVINEDNISMEFEPGELDYSFQMRFGEWFKEINGNGKTCVLTGIRADESNVRYMRAKTEINKYKEKQFLLEQVDGIIHGFPIYDWKTEDIWIYNGKFEKRYNHLYDLYYQAGLSIDEMRVANPFHSCGLDNLKLYKVIDPNNWGKLVGRVNGVNMAGLYGGTTAMGWKSITKPAHFTWKEYCYFLLNTLDEPLKNHYLQKLNTSIKFWKERGGALDDDIIEELEESGVDFENRGYVSKVSPKQVCAFEEYPDEVDVKGFREVPSYKRMCVCIMKNDFTCTYMGFSQTKEETMMRKRTMEKYSNL